MYNVLTTFWPRELNNDTFHRCRPINPSQYISISIYIYIYIYIYGYTLQVRVPPKPIPRTFLGGLSIPSNNFASGVGHNEMNDIVNQVRVWARVRLQNGSSKRFCRHRYLFSSIWIYAIILWRCTSTVHLVERDHAIHLIRMSESNRIVQSSPMPSKTDEKNPHSLNRYQILYVLQVWNVRHVPLLAVFNANYSTFKKHSPSSPK